MNNFNINTVIFILIFTASAVIGDLAAEKSKANNDTLVNRRVLILDFVNLKNSVDYTYLENSVPDSFLDPLDKTKSFELLPRSTWQKFVSEHKFKKEQAYQEEAAIDAGKFAGADVVIIGSFTTISDVGGDKMQIFARALELSSKRVMVSRNILAALDSSMFQSVESMTREMALEMKRKLPPLTQKVITIEREKYIERESVTYGGQIWRTAVAPGWGHLYAKQWRGWVYLPLWAGSLGTYIFESIDYSIKDTAYKTATSGLESKYTDLNTAKKIRNISLFTVFGIYAISITDILISGKGYIPAVGNTPAGLPNTAPMRSLDISLEPDLDGFRAIFQKNW